jgi:hypothetical protein
MSVTMLFIRGLMLAMHFSIRIILWLALGGEG